MLTTKNRSPYQTFGRSTFEPYPSDRDMLPKPTVTRPSHERMPFGGAERGGAYGGVLHPDGPGPFPEGFLDSSDLGTLPWHRPRGDEWTTPELRAAVLSWVRQLYARNPTKRLVGWSVVERATGIRKASRLPPQYHYLLISLTQRIGEGARTVEAAQAFPPREREGAALTARLDGARAALEVQLVAIP